MPLRKQTRPSVDAARSEARAEGRKSKRQWILDFFRSRKQKTAPITMPIIASKDQKPPPRDSKIAESTRPTQANGSVHAESVATEKVGETGLASPAAESEEKEGPEKRSREIVQLLSEEQIHVLFSGAPHFNVNKTADRHIPSASYPWDFELTTRDVSDSVQLAQPAFSAATLHRHLPVRQHSIDQDKQYQGYDLGVVELPSMLSAQGLEPGSVGFVHFLELPISDSLVTDLQQSQSSNGFLESVRNKEQMHSNPERLGIRSVDISMVYDRLVELGDLVEAFHDSPERMTILNNQSSGDLYANLFGKFLTPPPYDARTDDPTGIKVQIDTLLKILRLKGVWFDFSLVEWRIRLGQLLWSDSDLLEEHETHRSWTDREILLLQILLACELLLRLDAITSMDADDVKERMRVSPDDFQGFLELKARKTDWDLVLARRFLDNVLVVRDSDMELSIRTPKPRGLLSMLSRDDTKISPKEDVIFVPRHQARQLLGLHYFAETIQWPGIDLVIKDLTTKLGLSDIVGGSEQQPSPHGKFLDPSTPSSISVYGTPLATPRSSQTIRDSYFGNMTRPTLQRGNTSNSLTVPLSSTLVAHAGEGAGMTTNIGGWLSRSYLTGLLLPGEAINHFLISTLLENDKLAIAALGDTANLYGGFIYSGRSWWSKSSIVGRVLACIDGANECMGWISFTRLPEALTDGWYALGSEQLQPMQAPRISADEDLVARDSAVILGKGDDQVNPESLTLPQDLSAPPIPAVEFTKWNLTAIGPEPLENDASSASPSDAETFVASLVFSSVARAHSHTLKLKHDIQFVTSFPCTPPSASSSFDIPQTLKRSLSLSRSSSKRSVHSMRSGSNRPSRHPSRRNSHGFEPLLSHPPDSPGIAPTRVYSPIPDEQPGERSQTGTPKPAPMMAHPLHVAYKYKVIPATDVIDPNFILPFEAPLLASPTSSNFTNPKDDRTDARREELSVLVLDARASIDLQVLSRAWCAEKGLHAIIARVGRTCLGCCVREASGLGINVVIRV